MQPMGKNERISKELSMEFIRGSIIGFHPVVLMSSRTSVATPMFHVRQHQQRREKPMSVFAEHKVVDLCDTTLIKEAKLFRKKAN